MSRPDDRLLGRIPLAREAVFAAIDANPGEGFPWIVAPKGVAPERRIDRQLLFLAFALRAAIQVNDDANGPRFAHLPVPVRHRVAGSPDCWDGVREAAGGDGAALWSKLHDARCSPSQLRHDLTGFAVRHLGRARPDDAQLDGWAAESALIQSA